MNATQTHHTDSENHAGVWMTADVNETVHWAMRAGAGFPPDETGPGADAASWHTDPRTYADSTPGAYWDRF